jgi:hypothetical protein
LKLAVVEDDSVVDCDHEFRRDRWDRPRHATSSLQSMACFRRAELIQPPCRRGDLSRIVNLYTS